MQFTVASGIFLCGWFGWDSCHRLRVRAQRWLPEHPGLWRRMSGHHWGPWWYPVPWSHQLKRWNPVRPGGWVLTTKDHQDSTPKSPEKFCSNPQHLREILMKKVILVASNFILQILSAWSVNAAGLHLPIQFLCVLPRYDGLVCLALKYWKCSLFLDQLLDECLSAGKRPEIEHWIYHLSATAFYRDTMPIFSYK